MTRAEEYEIEIGCLRRIERVGEAMKALGAWCEAPANAERMRLVREGDPVALATYRGFADELQRRATA